MINGKLPILFEDVFELMEVFLNAKSLVFNLDKSTNKIHKIAD